MENRKINIAKILRACPKGMELECTMFDNVTFELVDNDVTYPIKIMVGKTQFQRLTAFGEWDKTDVCQDYYTKCVIFPKGKTNWEGFVPPYKFKDGDIITDSLGTCIFKGEGMCNGMVDYYCGLIDSDGCFVIKTAPETHFGPISGYRLATKAEKERLFTAIEDNGYVWDAEEKRLEMTGKPEFKDGDIVATKEGGWIGITTGGISTEFIPTYCVLDSTDEFSAYFENKETWKFNRLANDEEKERLFKAIEDNGYQWDPDTKTLEKLPKFKDGDIVSSIIGIGSTWIGIFKQYEDKGTFETYCSLNAIGKFYNTNTKIHVLENTHLASEEEKQELFQAIKDNGYKWNTEKKCLEKLKALKFDLNTLVPFEDKVLVRNEKTDKWFPATWGFYDDFLEFSYTVEGGNGFNKCIPYKGNEHLLGTTDDCDKYFKTWEE